MFLIRLLIVGETGVGKTSLLVRFNEDNFVTDQKTTIGVDYKAKEVKIGQESVKLQVWDTAGQERFRSMTAAFYHKAQGIVLTFDVSSRASFESLSNWIRDIKESAPVTTKIILCANKIDIPMDLRQVKKNEYERLGHEHNFDVIECSASTGENVQSLFLNLGKLVLETNREALAEMEEEREHGQSLILQEYTNRRKPKKNSCCY